MTPKEKVLCCFGNLNTKSIVKVTGLSYPLVIYYLETAGLNYKKKAKYPYPYFNKKK